MPKASPIKKRQQQVRQQTLDQSTATILQATKENKSGLEQMESSQKELSEKVAGISENLSGYQRSTNKRFSDAKGQISGVKHELDQLLTASTGSKEKLDAVSTLMRTHLTTVEDAMASTSEASSEALEFVQKSVASMETLVKKTNAAGQSVSVQTSELLRVLSALIEINREPMTLSDDTVGEISGAIKAQVVAHLNEDLNSISDEVSGKVTQPLSRAAGRVESAVTRYETVLRDLQDERAHWEVLRAAERGWQRQLLRTVGAFGLHAAALLLSVVWLVMPVGALLRAFGLGSVSEWLGDIAAGGFTGVIASFIFGLIYVVGVAVALWFSYAFVMSSLSTLESTDSSWQKLLRDKADALAKHLRDDDTKKVK